MFPVGNIRVLQGRCGYGRARFLAGNIHPPRWSPVIPAVHQGQRSSELQTALQVALPLSCSFLISISFDCGQESVSGALVSRRCVKKQPCTGSRAVQGETLLLLHSLGRTGERRGKPGCAVRWESRIHNGTPPVSCWKGQAAERAFPCSKICNFYL